MPPRTDGADEQAELSRLADDVVPGLIAHIEASRLGELEVRRGGWRVRLRRMGRPERDGRSRDESRSDDPRSGAAPISHSAGTGGRAGGSPLTGSRQDVEALSGSPMDRGRTVVTSPAVGYFLPLGAQGVGGQVRQGDVLGHVDVLGVRQDVVAASDGVISRLLAEAGQAVEYGQGLVRIDPVGRAERTPPETIPGADDPRAQEESRPQEDLPTPQEEPAPDARRTQVPA